MTFTIAVDAMGGDLGPRVALKGCINAVQCFDDLRIILFAHEEERAWLDRQALPDAIELRYSPQIVSMEDKPSQVLRRKRESSMAQALMVVADGEASACLSSGNSGALMGLSRSIIKTHVMVDRPALATDIPANDGHFLMLDLGANIQPRADHLYQFALMGDAWSRAQGKQSPSVVLLNIGKEAAKGTEEIQLAAQHLNEAPVLNFQGFVEGDGLYVGNHDVVVCDGFSGNVALKTSEGLIKLMNRNLAAAVRSSLLGRFMEPLAKRLLDKASAQLNPVANSGAMLLGLQQLVIKTHGNSDERAFFYSIEYALQQCRQGVVAGFVQNMDDFDQ